MSNASTATLEEFFGVWRFSEKNSISSPWSLEIESPAVQKERWIYVLLRDTDQKGSQDASLLGHRFRSTVCKCIVPKNIAEIGDTDDDS
jgi:hypothetical protein